MIRLIKFNEKMIVWQHLCNDVKTSHQKEYFKLHKRNFTDKELLGAVYSGLPSIYTASELVVEEEPRDESDIGFDSHKSSNDAIEYTKSSLFPSHETLDEDDEDDDKNLEQHDLNDMTGIGAGGTSDAATMEFYTRIGRRGGDVREQCLRYCRWPLSTNHDPTLESGHEDLSESGDGPLWISSQYRLGENDVPKCQYCGSDRKFEFQIMPQMLHFLFDKRSKNVPNDNSNRNEAKQALLAVSDIYDRNQNDDSDTIVSHELKAQQEELVGKLKNDTLGQSPTSGGNETMDWGVIAVYTCTMSCGGGDAFNDITGAYRREFAWRQPPLS